MWIIHCVGVAVDGVSSQNFIRWLAEMRAGLFADQFSSWDIDQLKRMLMDCLAQLSQDTSNWAIYQLLKDWQWSSRQGVKRSPYSITERRVPELIRVLGSQPAGDVSHKPGGWLTLLSARPAVNLATLKRAASSFAAWWTEARWVWTVCLRLLPDSVAAAIWTMAWVQHANHSQNSPVLAHPRGGGCGAASGYD